MARRPVECDPVSVADLFEHVDYRTFLKEWMDEEKRRKPFVSYRYLGARIGIDPGQLAKVLGCTRHLSEELADHLARFVGLEGKDLEYFSHLVRFTKAKTPTAIRLHFEKLQSLRGFHPEIVGEAQVEFFSDWRLPAMRALLSFHAFDGDWARLGRRLSPAITAEEASQAVARLERLGFLIAKDSGGWEVASPFLTTGSQWRAAAIRHFQLETLHLAEHSLAEHPPEWRDISTLTLSFPRSALPEIKARLAETRESILKMVKEMGDADAAFQLNVQLFPLTDLEDAQP